MEISQVEHSINSISDKDLRNRLLKIYKQTLDIFEKTNQLLNFTDEELVKYLFNGKSNKRNNGNGL